ncbi:MAG: type II secretion system F family protein [Myxococcota bacterium]
MAPERRASPRGLRSRRADVVEAIRYLATLMSAGFPLDRALGTVARVVVRADVSGALRAVRERVRAGSELADALAERPRMFPRLAVGMTRAGERGGHLAEALERLAQHLEREERLRSQVVSAMLYPLLVMGVGGVAVLVLLLYVLPRFVGILDEVGAGLPLSTLLLLNAGAFLGRWWPALLLGAVLAALLVTSSRRSESGRARSDAVLARLPVLGPLRQRLAAARFGRSLSTLLDNGLPILPALDISASGLADAAAAAEVMRAREEVQAGVRLALALRRGRAFPYVFLQMVELGEESGQLAQMLERAATAAEQELERGLERLVRLVEPAMIVVFGAAAGFIALSLLQAVYGIRMDAF